MRKSIIRIGCFSILLIAVLLLTNKIFKVKYGDGLYDVTKFYELPENSVDVLILGSSHAFEDFNTGTLWDGFGMSSFVLGGSVQPMWNTYYYLKEALKTQKPELIILEGYMATYTAEFIDDSRIIKNNYGLKWSADKVDSIKISSPEERWTEFMLEYVQYHTRYIELSRADFMPNQGNPIYADWKGFGNNMATTPLEATDVSGVVEGVGLYEKTEEYYRKTIELAKENNIPIIIVISPYAGITEGEQQMYITAQSIAEEYDVEFLNCNLILDSIGMDFSQDAADAAHLNYKGNQKFSSYIGAYIKENYQVSDHRGDSKYATWDRGADYIEQQIYNQKLVEQADANEIAQMMLNENYRLMVSVDGSCTTADEQIMPFLSKIGVSTDGVSGIWYRDSNGIVWSSGSDEAEQYIRTTAHDFCMRRSSDENGNFTNSLIVDNAPYTKVTNGVNVVIYDTVTETVVTAFGLNKDDNFNIIK